MKTKVLGISAMLLLAASAFAGEVSVKPGLWEVTAQSPEFSAMQQQMAKMPPAEREQMETMLAKQGIKMDEKGMVIQTCITPDMAKQAIVPVQQHGKCTATTAPRAGNTIKTSYTCTEPPSSGESEVTFQSDTAYSATVRSTQNGKNMDLQASGRWLKADCGAIKPVSPPPAK